MCSPPRKSRWTNSFTAASYIYHAQPVADLAEKLAQITPKGLTKTFFGNGGAEAIEGALKLARLYTGKHEFISLQSSFHGRSFGALSITGNYARKKKGGPYATGVSFAPAPYVYRSNWPNDPEECARQCARAIDDVVKFATSNDVAAFIAEPVMGEGGIIVPPANYFQEVKKVLDHYGILFIADEVQSGFGRTGKMFAIEYYGVVPDILVAAKGIADGFPLSSYTARPEIADAYKPGDHLSTFGGNPVSCAAALANIEFFEKENLLAHTVETGNYAIGKLRELQKRHALIGEVRGLGLMIGVELVKGCAEDTSFRRGRSDSRGLPPPWHAHRSRRYCRKRCPLPAAAGHHQAANRSGHRHLRPGAAGSRPARSRHRVGITSRGSRKEAKRRNHTNKKGRSKAASSQKNAPEYPQLFLSKSRSRQLIAQFTSPSGCSEHSSTDQSSSST